LRSSRLALVLLFLLAVAAPATGEVFLSQREALELAFPGADRIEKKSTLLDDAQALSRAARRALESRLVTLHAGWRGDELLGYALIDAHRAHPAEAFLMFSPDGSVRACAAASTSLSTSRASASWRSSTRASSAELRSARHPRHRRCLLVARGHHGVRRRSRSTRCWHGADAIGRTPHPALPAAAEQTGPCVSS
jgi:hypothetical protein